MAALLALDQGTSSSRAVVFGPDGRILAVARGDAVATSIAVYLFFNADTAAHW